MSNQTMQIPPGVNLEDDIGPTVIRIVAPVLAITILSVVARLYARWLKKCQWSTSDYTIIAGLFVSGALSGICLYGM
jgi:hypothetical protein